MNETSIDLAWRRILLLIRGAIHGINASDHSAARRGGVTGLLALSICTPETVTWATPMRGVRWSLPYTATELRPAL